MNWKILFHAIRIPLILNVLASIVASWYAAVYKIEGITFGAPILLTSLAILYLAGTYGLMKIRKRESVK